MLLGSRHKSPVREILSNKRVLGAAAFYSKDSLPHIHWRCSMRKVLTMAEPLESETSELFKQAFGHHPAGVAVITATDDAGEPAGFTASSLTHDRELRSDIAVHNIFKHGGGTHAPDFLVVGEREMQRNPQLRPRDLRQEPQCHT